MTVAEPAKSSKSTNPTPTPSTASGASGVAYVGTVTPRVSRTRGTRRDDPSLDDFLMDERSIWARSCELTALRILQTTGRVSADDLNHALPAYPFDKRAFGATLKNLHTAHLIQPRRYFPGRHGRPILEYELWTGRRP
jgi:hypothetical protein